MPDSGGFIYLNPNIFRENFAQDVDPAEANIMAIAQKPFHQSNLLHHLVLRHGKNYQRGIKPLSQII